MLYTDIQFKHDMFQCHNGCHVFHLDISRDITLIFFNYSLLNSFYTLKYGRKYIIDFFNVRISILECDY